MDSFPFLKSYEQSLTRTPKGQLPEYKASTGTHKKADHTGAHGHKRGARAQGQKDKDVKNTPKVKSQTLIINRSLEKSMSRRNVTSIGRLVQHVTSLMKCYKVIRSDMCARMSTRCYVCSNEHAMLCMCARKSTMILVRSRAPRVCDMCACQSTMLRKK